MKMTRILGISVGILALSMVSMTVANAQKKKGPGILNPDWKSEGGTYAAPMGKLGTKGETWTATTMGAAIAGKANPAKPVTMVGEIVDFSCYLQIGKHGEKHRSCAQKCFKAGQPVGLMTDDGTLYMLMDEEHDPRRDGLTDFRTAAVEHASHIMEVTGTLSEHAGFKAIYVQGYLKK